VAAVGSGMVRSHAASHSGASRCGTLIFVVRANWSAMYADGRLPVAVAMLFGSSEMYEGLNEQTFSVHICKILSI